MEKMTIKDVLKMINNGINYAEKNFPRLLDGFVPTNKEIKYVKSEIVGQFKYLDILQATDEGNMLPVFVLSDNKGNRLSFGVNDFDVFYDDSNIDEEPREVMLNTIKKSILSTLAKRYPEYGEDYATHHWYRDLETATKAYICINDLLLRDSVSGKDYENLYHARETLEDFLNKRKVNREEDEQFNAHRTFIMDLMLSDDFNK